MLPENAIEVKNVKKAFRIYKDKGNSLKERIIFRDRNNYDVRTVLRGISFSIKKGEAVGLIGHNGCGKSTTLKLLTKIMYPDSGTIEMRGRVSSLLELGAGFHPDMSGRENIYINASIFGLTRKEIDERLEEIIDFSELGSYIDNPVRTYSSGMYMRLAFSVAINVNADIILVDEILSVGDLNFQNKCLKKLQAIKKAGTTIVIVSHSMEQIESICDRSIWLNDGEIVADDIPGLVHRKYLEFMGNYNFKDSAASDSEKEEKENQKKEEKTEAELAKERFERKGSGEVRIKKVALLNEKKEEQKVFAIGEEMQLAISYKVSTPIKVNIYIGILRMDYMLCYGTEYKDENKKFIKLTEDGELILDFPALPLLPSRYMIDIRIQSEKGNDIDVYNEAIDFQVYSVTKETGLARIEHKWLI
nr:ABC transporter ATP-binding protein [uncultured Blautia sp.]